MGSGATVIQKTRCCQQKSARAKTGYGSAFLVLVLQPFDSLTVGNDRSLGINVSKCRQKDQILLSRVLNMIGLITGIANGICIRCMKQTDFKERCAGFFLSV